MSRKKVYGSAAERNNITSPAKDLMQEAHLKSRKTDQTGDIQREEQRVPMFEIQSSKGKEVVLFGITMLILLSAIAFNAIVRHVPEKEVAATFIVAFLTTILIVFLLDSIIALFSLAMGYYCHANQSVVRMIRDHDTVQTVLNQKISKDSQRESAAAEGEKSFETIREDDVMAARYCKSEQVKVGGRPCMSPDARTAPYRSGEIESNTGKEQMRHSMGVLESSEERKKRKHEVEARY